MTSVARTPMRRQRRVPRGLVAAALGCVANLTAAAPPADPPTTAPPSAETRPVGPGAADTVVPTNEVLRPAGLSAHFYGRPVDMVLSPDGKTLFVKNIRMVTVLDVRSREVIQRLDMPTGASFVGIERDAAGERVYATDSKSSLHVASWRDGILRWERQFRLPAQDGGQSAPGGLALSEDENAAYVTLSRNNTVARLDLTTGDMDEIEVGVCPYDVLLHPDGKAYVTNWGGRQPLPGDETSRTSGSLIVSRRGIANSGSLSVVDLATRKAVKSIDVGLHPSGMALSPDGAHLFVCNAASDTVSVVDTRTDEVVGTVLVRLDDGLPFGSSPNACAVSADGSTLFVANGTDNAIAVVDVPERRVKGFIPTGWYPGSVVVRDDLLMVANIKGIGSRNTPTDWNGAYFNSHGHMGSVQFVRIPDDPRLASYTEVCRDGNRLSAMKAAVAWRPATGARRLTPVPRAEDEVSPIEHVVYIIKENRTYDQVFGDLPQGNGDPSLCIFGREVTPNQHRLVEEFVLLDNTYCSGVLSADGHNWTNSAFATDYLERMFGGWTRSYGEDPLAYPPTGFLWDNVLDHGKTFRCYGELAESRIEPRDAKWEHIYRDYIEGTNRVKLAAEASHPALQPYVSPTYMGWPMTTPDVHRARAFLDELAEFERQGSFPNLALLLLPNDHTAGMNPAFPTPRAMVADNDLALGRIIEGLSRSAFWKKMAVFVIQDDPQNGYDHVDGHRTVCLVISPYVRRGSVVSTNYNQTSIVRTIELILGLPPMNQNDASATPMYDCFTDTPDFTPYTAVANQVALDEMNQPVGLLEGEARHWAESSVAQDLSEVDRIDEDTFNRAIWYATRGAEPYPAHFVHRRDGDD